MYLERVCPGSSIFTLIPGVQTSTYTVNWDFGDGSGPVTTTNTATTPHDYTSNGVYNLTVTVTDSNNCSTTISDSIYVFKPIASFELLPPAFFCDQTNITILGGIGDSSGYANNWYFVLTPPFGIPKTNIATQGSNSFTTTLNVAGVWSLMLISSNPGVCTDTLFQDTLVVVPGPTGYFTFEPDTGCSPLTVTFHVTPIANAEYIIADFGDGNVTGHLPLTDTIITHTYYGNTGAQWEPAILLGYNLDGTQCDVEIPNINDTLNGHSTKVTIINPATFSVTVDTIHVNEGEMDTLTSFPGYDPSLTYSWTVLPSGQPLISLSPPSSAVFIGNEGDEKILLVVTDPDGCQSYDTVYIVMRLCEKELVIPNVFTPSGEGSGDGKNDTYYIKDLCPIEDFRIIIFNRWGNIVYESTDYAFKWDGTDDNGKDCSEGVYYYTLHAKRNDLHGYIHLIRGKDKD